MGIQYTPYSILALLASFMSIFLMLIIWRRRSGQNIRFFMLLMVALSIWAFASAIEMSVTNLNNKVLINSLSYLGVVTVPTSLFLFVIDYTGRDYLLTRRNLILLSIFPILTLLAVATDPLHHEFWTSIVLTTDHSYQMAVYNHGILFWLHVAYSYLMMVLSAILLIRAFIRSPQVYRGQMSLIFVGMAAPWVANGLYVFEMSPLPAYVDLTPLAFTVTGLTLGWNMYRFRMMDLIPVARDRVIETMLDAVIVFDPNNRIVDANPAAFELLQKTGEQVIGKDASQVFVNHLAVIAQFEANKQKSGEIPIVLDDIEHTYKMHISPFYNRQGDLTGRTVVLHEITALKNANQQLIIAKQEAEAADQMKSQFLATMSHELRTPLNAIIGYTELQLTGMVGELSDIHYQYAERTLANAEHLLELINDILDLSKIEAGRVQLAAQSFNLREWATNIVEQYRILATDKDLELREEIAPELPEIAIGDELRLKQIVVNLLSNAIKFTAEGHVLFKLAKESEDRWCIIIADTGIGISPHLQETVFDEFYQVDGSSTRDYGGTGLGLAIVRKLVMLMKGTIHLESALEKGSTFSISLPIIKESIGSELGQVERGRV